MPQIVPLTDQLNRFKNECFEGKDAKRIALMYNSCVIQTKDFVKGSGFSDVVIGLSGGIDSALVASIAVDALGSDHVHGVLLPGPYSSQSSISDATMLANNLSITTNTIFINDTYKSAVKSVAEGISKTSRLKKLDDMTHQNIQARSRMMMIMALSNQYNWMMLNTSNKSEVYTGYSTLYGDMAGGFAPIGEVYKTDVFKMCVYKNLQSQRNNGTEIIPQNIIDKPPSAELTENQTDEASLGLDYASLDEVLICHIDKGMNFAGIVAEGYPENLVQSVIAKVKKSEYKRRYEPPAAEITV